MRTIFPMLAPTIAARYNADNTISSQRAIMPLQATAPLAADDTAHHLLPNLPNAPQSEIDAVQG